MRGDSPVISSRVQLSVYHNAEMRIKYYSADFLLLNHILYSHATKSIRSRDGKIVNVDICNIFSLQRVTCGR